MGSDPLYVGKVGRRRPGSRAVAVVGGAAAELCSGDGTRDTLSPVPCESRGRPAWPSRRERCPRPGTGTVPSGLVYHDRARLV